MRFLGGGGSFYLRICRGGGSIVPLCHRSTGVGGAGGYRGVGGGGGGGVRQREKRWLSTWH